jgi:hypothetical protein
VLALQASAGNRAATAALGRHRGAPRQRPVPRERPAVQRAIWAYQQNGQWASGANTADMPPGLEANGPFRPGDTYDDTDPLRRVNSGANADMKGQPNRVAGYQEVSAADQERMRRGLALAQAKASAAARAVANDYLQLRQPGGQPRPVLATAMEVLFNAAPRHLQAGEVTALVATLSSGLHRLSEGLRSEGLKLIAARDMVIYGTSSRADCTGWVPRYLSERGGRTTPATGSADLPSLSGDVHLNLAMLPTDEAIANTIIHEASHKFLGTFDYSYVGVAGATAQRFAAETVTHGGADAAAGMAQRRTHSALVRALVDKGIASVLPMADRTRPPAPQESAARTAARAIYATVRFWGDPLQAPPTRQQITQAATDATGEADAPSGLKSTLREYLAAPDTYLAEHGNELGVKAHDVMLTLPSGILLRNADSWTDLAITVI